MTTSATSTAFAQKYGPWAFVAGASMGIGLAFSNEAAARGLNVVMVARGKELLEQTAADVRETHGVEVRTLAADLADPGIGAIVADATDDLEIGLFVYNATVAPAGKFLDVPMDLQLLSIAVNCTTPTILCNHFGSKMARRGRGGIGIVSSMGATQGSINFGTYNAGKAYEWILAETLWAELRDRGVDVCNIFVGATASPNFKAFQETLDPELCGRADTDDPLDRARSRLMNPSEPRNIAIALYDQLGDGPVCWENPDDAWITEESLAMTRIDAVRTWKALQETSTHVPEKQAR